MEELFVQIFERKKWIIDQANLQANLFDQLLASKLIIEGIAPPTWLPFLPPHASRFQGAEVDKNCVSGVEFPRSSLEIRCSSLNEEFQHRLSEEPGSLNDGLGAGTSDAGFALNCAAPHIGTSPLPHECREGVVSEINNDPTVSLARLHMNVEIHSSRLNEELQQSAEAVSLNDDFDAGPGSRASVLPRCDKSDSGFPLNCAPRIDKSPFPHEWREGVVDRTMSLARLHRSKSRQRALKLRNSVKSARCRCRFANENDSIAGGIVGSAISLLKADHKDESEMVKPSSSSKGVVCVEEKTNVCCEQKDIFACSDKYQITVVGSPGLQSTSSNVDDSLNSTFKDEGLCVSEGSTQNSSQVNEQFESPRPSMGKTEYYEEGLGYCRSQESDFDNAEQSRLQCSSLNVDKSSCICPEDERMCPGHSKLHSDQVDELLDLPQPLSANIEYCDETILEHCRSQDLPKPHADNSSCLISEDGTLGHIGSSKRKSAQVSKLLELSVPSSVDIECHEVGLGDCRTQDNSFDINVEQSGLDKISSPPMIEEKTSDKKPSTFLDDKRDVNEKEECNSPLPMPLPQIQVASVEVDESCKGVSEYHSEKRSADRGHLNGNALSSSEKSLQGYEKVNACSLLQSGEPTEQNICLKDGVSNLQFSHKNVVEIPLLDTDNASILIRDSETCRDLMAMAPCAPSTAERYSNLEQQLKNSGISQCEDTDTFESCTGDFNGNHHYISTEFQTAERLTESKPFCSVLKAPSSLEKRRVVELPLENGTPASLGLRNEKLQIINRSPIDKKLMQDFDYEQPILELQRLSFCAKDCLQPNVNISPVEMLLLEKEAHSMQGSESSSTLTVKEDLSRFESNSSGITSENIVLESQNLDTKEIPQFGDYELSDDTGKSEGEEENGKLTSCSLITPYIQTSHYLGADKDRSAALEEFIMQADDERPCISVGGINFEKLDLSKCMIERASILEKLCKSACTNSPFSSSSESYKLHKVADLCHSLSLPNGLLESMDLQSNLLMDDQKKLLKDGSNFLNEEVNCSPHGRFFPDCLQSFSSNSAGDVKKPIASPFGKLLDRNSLNSSSSRKQSGQNIELPCISEEAENTDEVDDEFSNDMGSKERVPLADTTENENVQVTVSEAATFADRLSLESLNRELNNTGTHNRTKENLGNQKSSKGKYLNEAFNHDIFPGTNGATRVTRSSFNRFSRSDLSRKENLRKEGPQFSEKESKHKNIVSNMTSFIPLLQQSEAPTILKGKRDIKVKAIEVAEAAKRLAEKKENDRQMKKEALKLERARIEQENLRQIEFEKKKKEEERKKKEEYSKKKEANMASKKRQREEEERKEKERKRMRAEEVRRRLQGDKLRFDKENKEAKPQANEQKPRDRKGFKDATDSLKKESGHDNFDKLSIMETNNTSTSDAGRANLIFEDSQTTSVGSLEAEALENVMKNRISEISEEQSYQISPNEVSDDEDEEEDDDDSIQNNKFVPSWASKHRLAALFASQQKLNPELIFPPKSFCDVTDVLLPRQHQNE